MIQFFILGLFPFYTFLANAKNINTFVEKEKIQSFAQESHVNKNKLPR